MQKADDKLALLRALKARLELDADLGATHIAGHGLELGCIERVLIRTPISAPPGFTPKVEAPVQPPVPQSVRSLPADTVKPSTPRVTTPPPEAKPVHPASASLVPWEAPPPSPEKEAELEPLRLESLACQGCELCGGRNSVVWGEGNLDAEVMFIGEGPGRDEDAEGRPFVGRSGRLLTDIIEKGMRVGRNQVYIANVVKCRPPGNRDPKPAEVSACSRYLHKQIEVIKPRAIVAVGGVAGCALLNLPPRTPGLRGQWREYQGIPMRVIFHPSYLLRQRNGAVGRTQADRDTWNDIQEVMAKLGWNG